MVPDENATSSIAFLPTLTSISLTDYEANGNYPINMIAFIDALRSRASQGLRQVLLSRNLPLQVQQHIPEAQNVSSFLLEEPAVIEKLHQLRDQGLNIRVLVEGRDILD
ncbi:hypothetical protein FIBSPDRAFT_930184 [Athelia psychrophila]|uniref:Uncharacterized protein n=1 Tax=Athelia psychrophila TaxID=1759441 RepID=A0A166MG50_9AGAM|nr:hypothetical protein FIBSPDRAFT_930184 [Fibularhizoctonia sp. CBS 109695]